MTICINHVRFFVCALLFCYAAQAASIESQETVPYWTWLHAIHYSSFQRLKNRNKNALIFEKEQVNSFSQLILSWNAFRPQNGFFTFDVRVRDKQSKIWSEWKKMHEWGSGLQKSFYGTSDGIASVQHVRLEVERNREADAFSVRIKAHKGASLSAIANCYVCLSYLPSFLKENHEVYPDLDSVYIDGIPHYSQFLLNHSDNNRICSPTSCSMVLSYLLKSSVSPLEFAQLVYDEGLDTYGSWPYNVTHGYHVSDGKYKWYVTRLHSFWYLHQHLLKKMPIVVSVRGTLEGAPKDYMNGHLLVVVGFDKETKTVLCHDPAVVSQNSILQKYPLESFIRAWEKSHRLAYIVDIEK